MCFHSAALPRSIAWLTCSAVRPTPARPLGSRLTLAAGGGVGATAGAAPSGLAVATATGGWVGAAGAAGFPTGAAEALGAAAVSDDFGVLGAAAGGVDGCAVGLASGVAVATAGGVDTSGVGRASVLAGLTPGDASRRPCWSASTRYAAPNRPPL